MLIQSWPTVYDDAPALGQHLLMAGDYMETGDDLEPVPPDLSEACHLISI